LQRAQFAALLVVLTVVAASAQQAKPDEPAQLRRGARIIWTGVALAAAGAITMPITDGFSNTNEWRVVAGSSLMMAGGLVIAFGMRAQQQAVAPQSTVRLTVTRGSAAVRLHRTW